MDNMDNKDTFFIPPNSNPQIEFMQPNACLRWERIENEKVLMQMWVSVNMGHTEWKKVPEE